jgi:hypothetical protein
MIAVSYRIRLLLQWVSSDEAQNVGLVLPATVIATMDETTGLIVIPAWWPELA